MLRLREFTYHSQQVAFRIVRGELYHVALFVFHKGHAETTEGTTKVVKVFCRENHFTGFLYICFCLCDDIEVVIGSSQLQFSGGITFTGNSDDTDT